MPKKSRVICVDDKIFKLLKNNGQVIAEGNKLSDSLQKVKTKADNMAAFKKAKKELNFSFSLRRIFRCSCLFLFLWDSSCSRL